MKKIIIMIRRQQINDIPTKIRSYLSKYVLSIRNKRTTMYFCTYFLFIRTHVYRNTRIIFPDKNTRPNSVLKNVKYKKSIKNNIFL